MATLTLMLDKRNKKAKKFPLVIRVSHKRLPKNIQLGYKLSENEWNETKKQIKSPFENSARANAKVQKKMTIASEVLSEYDTLLGNMNVYQITHLIKDRFEEIEQDQLSNSEFQHSSKIKLNDYGRKIIKRYQKAKRYDMANAFQDGIDMLLKFHGNDDLLITDINETFLEELEADYLGKGQKINGLGVRLRAIRRIFNLAIKDKSTNLTIEDYPFGKSGYSIKKERSKKRAVKLKVIDQIRQLEYPANSSLWHHRNYFLFMLNMRGMNFIDLAFLKLEAIQNERLKYKRRKTRRGQSVKEFDIKITSEAKQILDYYLTGKSKNDLIFPIMEDIINEPDELRVYEVYKNRLRNHNRRLNSIGKMIGLEEKLTSYVARHTFATAGLHKGVSKAQIGDMLGHTNYYTTEAYFDDFDKEVLDDAANQILG